MLTPTLTVRDKAYIKNLNCTTLNVLETIVLGQDDDDGDTPEGHVAVSPQRSFRGTFTFAAAPTSDVRVLETGAQVLYSRGDISVVPTSEDIALTFVKKMTGETMLHFRNMTPASTPATFPYSNIPQDLVAMLSDVDVEAECILASFIDIPDETILGRPYLSVQAEINFRVIGHQEDAETVGIVSRYVGSPPVVDQSSLLLAEQTVTVIPGSRYSDLSVSYTIPYAVGSQPETTSIIKFPGFYKNGTDLYFILYTTNTVF